MRLKKVQMRGGARRPQVRRTFCTLNLRSRAPTKQMGLFQPPARLLEVLGQALDLPAQIVPLADESSNYLGRAPGTEALDFPRQNVPVAGRLAQNRVQSLVSLVEAGEEVGVELVYGTAVRCRD